MTALGVQDGLPDWIAHLSQAEMQRMFGAAAMHAASSYQRRGAVRSVERGADEASIVATVFGRRSYLTRVSRASRTAPILSRCTCPMGSRCKHVIALILQAQVERIADHPGPGETPVWESLLAPVVQDNDPALAGTTPLGLLFEVPDARTSALGSRLLVRPLTPGATGGWIRTGIAWSEFQYAQSWRHFHPDHREALAAILRAERSRDIYYGRAALSIAIDQLGPSMWALLDAAAAAGVAMVSGAKGGHSVTLCREPATTVLDASRSSSGDITVRPAVVVPGVEGAPALLGDPPHGAMVRTPTGIVLARLAAPLKPPMARLLTDTGAFVVPGDDAPRFFSRYYPALRQQATISSTDGTVDLPEVHPPKLVLRVSFHDGHRTVLRWAFRYRVGGETTDVPLHGEGAGGAAVVRDTAAQDELLAGLDVLDAVPGLRNHLTGRPRPDVIADASLHGWATVLFVRDLLPALSDRDDIDVEITGTPLPYEQFDGAAVIAVSASDTGTDAEDSAQDWFDLGITVTVADQDIPLASLLTAMTLGEERIILDNGTWFSLDTPDLQALRRIVAEARAMQDRESDRLRISRYQAGLWEELVELGVVAHQSQRWEQSVGALLQLSELPHPLPPPTLTASLRNYQLEGYQWLSFLWDQQLGGILADDMGLGKTLQTLAMAERARQGGTLTPQAPILVVAPTSVVAAWGSEAAKFAPDLQVAMITQTARKSGVALSDAIAGAHLVVTSYALFRIEYEQYGERTWGALVLDEAQFVKNHQAKTYQLARTLPAPVKLAITGTPLENSLMDLWALLSIVAPGLFPSPQRFGELYRRPIESGQSPELLSSLCRRIRPLMLRRTKEAVARELPPKIEQVVAVPLNPAHRRIYDTHLQRERQRILGLLDDVDRNRIAILTALTTLRQLSLDVHLVVPDAPASVTSSKIDALLDQLVEVVAEGHRCLVFSQFTTFLRMVRERLAAEGIGHVYLDGRTRDRPKRIAEFTDGDAPVFLISLKAGGSGLTLTQADYVFVLDPWWNPAVEAQAVDRTHRIGQDKTVMVYRLVSQDTIEEKVVALQERKRDLFARVVDDGGLMAAPLTADDIRGLLDA